MWLENWGVRKDIPFFMRHTQPPEVQDVVKYIVWQLSVLHMLPQDFPVRSSVTFKKTFNKTFTIKLVI